MSGFLLFIARIADVLFELYEYAQKVAADKAATDAEQERQIAMRLTRAAVDEMARREITGP